MNYSKWALWFMLLIPVLGFSQHATTLHGIVYDEKQLPMPGCHVHFGKVCAITDNEGHFELEHIHPGMRQFTFTFIGYQKKDTLVNVHPDQFLIIYLKPDVAKLGEVTIHVQRFDTAQSQKNEVINERYLTKNLSGTFVKSLEKLAGINAMEVGANASKPVIRGMGFNRVVVSENGIKQESQQWGADHGLEIDPFAVEAAEIMKGASPVEYGSDALGGVININNNDLPVNGPLAASVSLLAKSINNFLGGSIKLQQRHNRFFYKGRISYTNFGDYRIPADTIVYLTRKIPVANRRLKNTAGQELDVSGQLGYITTHVKSVLSLSNVHQKSGFFPGAHGIPTAEKVADDGDSRNVDFPYQEVNHFKALMNTKWFIHPAVAYLDFGFQQNHRQELSFFHSHFPGQNPPEENPNLELDFLLSTYTANAKVVFEQWEHHALTLGLQNQLKTNRVAGYSYFLPEYDRFTSGIFVKDDWTLNSKWKLFGGIRFDYGIYQGFAYFDSLVYNYVLTLPDRTLDDALYYAQRSVEVKTSYPGVSWHLGATWQASSKLLARVNVGKAFRIPTAVELGANGVHHGSYRFEVGDPDLNNEESYYADMHWEWKQPEFFAGVGAYSYYFTNFLYLQPTGELDHPIPDAGGIYYYRQSKALLSGLEGTLSQTFFKRLTLDANVELPYNYLINDNGLLGYGVPFSPPVNGYVALTYRFANHIKAALNNKWALAKTRSIGQGEEPTPGYTVFGMSVSYDVKWNKNMVNMVFQVQNILNTKYYNSMSYYRKLNIPEQGRNFQFMLKIPFGVQ